jgi:hypothetical protein
MRPTLLDYAETWAGMRDEMRAISEEGDRPRLSLAGRGPTFWLTPYWCFE